MPIYRIAANEVVNYVWHVEADSPDEAEEVLSDAGFPIAGYDCPGITVIIDDSDGIEISQILELTGGDS